MMSSPQSNDVFVRSPDTDLPHVHRMGQEAMATVYELFIEYPDREYARQAGWAALEVLEKIEQDLSRFISNSDISRLNHQPAGVPLILGEYAFDCLQAARRMYEQTGGVFDVTVGNLYECFFDNDRSLKSPDAQSIASARALTGMNLVELDEKNFTAQVAADGVRVDLGGIGKGFAVDCMIDVLREWDITSAMIHGGGSTVYCMGAPSGKAGWPISLSMPGNDQQILAQLAIKDMALSGSGSQRGYHILDPRSGEVVRSNITSWAITTRAVDADALSTAFMILSPPEIEQYCDRFADVKAMIIRSEQGQDSRTVLHWGPWTKAELTVPVPHYPDNE